MALFSRRRDARRPDAADQADGESTVDTTEESASAEEISRPEGAEPASEVEPEVTGEAPAKEPGEPGGPAAEASTEHLEPGPFDVAEAPEQERIDLGALQVPALDGMELRMEVDQRTNAVTGANLVIAGSSLQVQAFAAPKSRGLWDEVRGSLRDSVVRQGGTAETREGTFGTELITRLPVKRADGRTAYRPARFIGVDGPRWFLRAILTGKALGDPEQARVFENLVSRLVVVRGGDAMAPQELIPLHLPGQRPGVPTQGEQGLEGLQSLDPDRRGPEITQIG